MCFLHVYIQETHDAFKDNELNKKFLQNITEEIYILKIK
jgi:hypothetical protein